MSQIMSKTTNIKTPKVLTFNAKEKMVKNKTRGRESNVMNVKAFDTFRMNILTFLGNRKKGTPPPFLTMSQMRRVKVSKPLV